MGQDEGEKYGTFGLDTQHIVKEGNTAWCGVHLVLVSITTQRDTDTVLCPHCRALERAARQS